MEQTEGQGGLKVADEVNGSLKLWSPKSRLSKWITPVFQRFSHPSKTTRPSISPVTASLIPPIPAVAAYYCRMENSPLPIAGKSGCAMVAYLSASSTAETGDIVLVDEGITLAGAFQMAGFRYVVATMWEGDDDVYMKVSESLYANIAEGRGVAWAVHDAVVKARGVGWRMGKVLDWAPFIHNGA